MNSIFLKALAEKRKDEELSQLIDNAFKRGEKASHWQLKKLMSSMSKYSMKHLEGMK